MNKALFDEDEEEPLPAALRGRRRVCDAVEDYLAEYTRKSSTFNKKKAACKTLLDNFDKKGIFFVDQITRRAMSDHRSSLATDISIKTSMVLGASSQHCYTVEMRHLLKNMLDRDGLTPDVYHSYKLARYIKPSVYVATDEETSITIRVGDIFWDIEVNPGVKYFRPALRRFHKAKMRLVLCFSVSLASRISETCNIRTRDYNRDLRQITLPKTKAGKERIVSVPPVLAAEIEAWLRVRPKKADSEFLLINEDGNKLQPAAVTSLYRRYMEFARSQGYDLPRITMHSHRHKAISAMVKINPRHAQLVAGHSKITTTIENYDHQVADAVRETHEKADVLTRLLPPLKSRRVPKVA